MYGTGELVIAVEERFGITIKDVEAEAVITVGDLTRLVLSRIALRTDSICHSLRAFLQRRADVRSVISNRALRIRPRQRIAEAIPIWRRRALWRRLARQMGSTPTSRSPRSLKWLLLATAVILGVAGLSSGLIDPAVVPLSLLAALFLWMPFAAILVYIFIEPAAEMTTFGGAARRIAGTRAAQVRSDTDRSASAVAEELRNMIAESLVVDRGVVVPTASFVTDLGAG